MRIRTLFLYLIGNREAIHTIANHPAALWLGALFVLSAGFAREYDGEDLLHEPWHVLLPVGASLVTSFILFLITYGRVMVTDPARPAFFSAYRSFLALYWMTAPLAWLYAVPYERFLSPAGAVTVNLWTLGLVAVWRVLLMTRVVSVVMGYRLMTAFVLVMVFADALAILVTSLMPVPIINIMGGVRLSQSEMIIAEATCCIRILSICSAPIWVIGALTHCWYATEAAWQVRPGVEVPQYLMPKGLLILAAASLAVWIAVLPFTQPEQQRRRHVERLLKTGLIAEGLAEMSRHSPDDFPPHWDPPPRVNYGKEVPAVVEVLEAMTEQPPAPWVRELYMEKLRPYLTNRYHRADSRMVRALLRHPDGRALVLQERSTFEMLLRNGDLELSPDEKEDLKTLLSEKKDSRQDPP